MKIYVLNPILDKGVDYLREHADVVLWNEPQAKDWHEDAEGIIVRNLTKVRADDFIKAKKLKGISKQGVGVDNVDLAEAKKHGVTVMNTPGVNSESVAEFTLGLAIAASRLIVYGDRLMHSGHVPRNDQFPKGLNLHGKTVGIIGMGAIGRCTAKKYINAFDMTVLGYSPSLSDETWDELGYEHFDNLHDMLPLVDYLSIHTPISDRSRNLIGETELALMKPTAVLVNTARGGIVDEDALYEALKNEKLFAAASDVFATEPAPADHPLLTLDNFTAAGHVAGMSVSVQEAAVEVLTEQLVTFLKTGEAPNRVE